ncbi:General stress protein 20U [compost metagenome]
MQRVESAWKDLEYLAGELSKGIELAGEQKDEPTADMLTGLKGKVEKHIWMLKSYLK